jgi:hypothetical protein
MPETNEFAILQADIAEITRNLGPLDDVEVVIYRPRSEDERVELEQRVNSALCGLPRDGYKGGLTIMVMMPELRVIDKDTPGPQCEMVNSIYVLENPMINEGEDGTGMSAEMAGIAILQNFHHRLLNPYTLVYADTDALREVPVTELEDYPECQVCYEVRLTSALPLNSLQFVSAPIITNAGGNITMTCGTAGAAIWVTFDGSCPSPKNENAVIYSAQFATPAVGVTVRAVAYLKDSGLYPSSCATLTII